MIPTNIMIMIFLMHIISLFSLFLKGGRTRYAGFCTTRRKGSSSFGTCLLFGPHKHSVLIANYDVCSALTLATNLSLSIVELFVFLGSLC